MRNQHPHPVVSIVFDRRDPIEQAIADLMEAGIARDQIEVVTDPVTARREFKDTLRKIPPQVLADAGRGALFGLVASSLLSAFLVLVVPLSVTGPLTLVQALGPNVGTVGGAVVGAAVGLFRHRRPDDLYCRVRQTGGILMLVHCRDAEQAERMLALLQPRGGHDGIVVQTYV
jgi:Na+/phosphate symporter